MLVVDTNVLVYAANRDSEFHQPCRRRLESLRSQDGAWYLTWNICYEFMRVVTHPRVLASPWSAEMAWQFLDALFAASGLAFLKPTGRHPRVLADVISSLPELRGNLMHDLHIAVLMREHGISRILTRDNDFHRFSFLEIVDPLR